MFAKYSDLARKLRDSSGGISQIHELFRFPRPFFSREIYDARIFPRPVNTFSNQPSVTNGIHIHFRTNFFHGCIGGWSSARA